MLFHGFHEFEALVPMMMMIPYRHAYYTPPRHLDKKILGQVVAAVRQMPPYKWVRRATGYRSRNDYNEI